MSKKTTMMTLSSRSLSRAVALMLMTPAYVMAAPAVPDAGTLLQQTKPTLQAPKDVAAEIIFQGQPLQESSAGGAQVALKSLSFGGNSLISESAITAALGDVVGKSYDLAGLKHLANQVSQYYRDMGYPFARAYLPPQNLSDGALKIEVLEGRYGNVTAKTENANEQADAQGYLEQIKSGDVIESKLLERTTLIMDDIPGYRAVPVVRPGSSTGTGDLEVRLIEKKQTNYDVSADNFGNRYTGENRIGLGVRHTRAFTFGDEINLNVLRSDENMFFGRLGYSLPVNSSGLRANFAYNRTNYSLGKNFSYLDAIGTADVLSAGLTYPIVRSQATNVSFNANLQHKELVDDMRSTSVHIAKSSNSIPVGINFDHRDTLGGGGVTYGALTYTQGSMSFSNDSNDAGNTRGDFNKVNLDVARIQALPENFSGFARVSAQKASRNLDTSEDLLLGGASAVRAYPQGEASGDEGYFMQVELRYAFNEFSPYAFYDRGHINTNASSSAATPNIARDIAGYGLGLRYNEKDWSADVFAAWRSEGGTPQADTTQDPAPRVWGSASYRF